MIGKTPSPDDIRRINMAPVENSSRTDNPGVFVDRIVPIRHVFWVSPLLLYDCSGRQELAAPTPLLSPCFKAVAPGPWPKLHRQIRLVTLGGGALLSGPFPC